MTLTYQEVHNEVEKMAEMYNESELKAQRNAYEQYVGLIIIDENISPLERETLFNLWAELKEDSQEN